MKIAALLGFCFILSGCINQEFERTNSVPIIEKRAHVEASIRLTAPRPIANAGSVVSHQQFLYVVERYEGLHIIDNSNPSAPRKTGFLRIPGSYHVALSGGLLVADNSADVLTFDLTDPSSPKVRERKNNILQGLPAPHPVSWGYDSIVDRDGIKQIFSRTLRSDEMITGYRDTTVCYNCGHD